MIVTLMLLESDIFQAVRPSLFQLGGIVPMSVVTLLLVALAIAAWKAPGWVKEIGLFTLALGFLWMAIGLVRHAGFMQEDDVITSRNLVWAGLRRLLIPFAYSIIVYLISLIIRIVRKLPYRSVHRWAKWIGHLALGLGLLGIPVGLIRTSNIMQVTGDASISAIWLGVRHSLIPLACALVVYLVSLILRLATKPREF